MDPGHYGYAYSNINVLSLVSVDLNEKLCRQLRNWQPNWVNCMSKLILARSLFLLPISLSMLKDSNLIHNG